MARRSGAFRHPELAARAAELAPPPQVVDIELGTFVFDPQVRWYRCEREGHRIYVTPSDLRAPAPSIESARSIVRWVEANVESLREGATERLWSLWDTAWRQDDEKNVDRATFRSRLRLDSIAWRPERGDDVTVCFDDDDVFGGHAIEVQIGGREVKSAEI